MCTLITIVTRYEMKWNKNEIKVVFVLSFCFEWMAQQEKNKKNNLNKFNLLKQKCKIQIGLIEAEIFQ